MPKIVIQNLHNKGIFEKDDTKTLLEMIHLNQVDWMFACGGKGRCTTCRAIVIDGLNNFSPETETEIKFKNADRLKSNERLACQCTIHGDVIIKVADENKFMHLHYSD
ncbi:(2Fe-2S)-binding protein [Reichenbachiella agarivorans]|uniref:(2Fe-2S)-binding protein n=1 Tax=Reichenbachiella agarivorans TaxID=2979464 RepID=A0ABY6CVV0_9BACT|nr:(2Fe-2S)-binding protein [Reichenbachiella agarivorans]UXP33593.1 (2Fe-2S)-binding protein [Reichenbachiella agarivorans]